MYIIGRLLVCLAGCLTLSEDWFIMPVDPRCGWLFVSGVQEKREKVKIKFPVYSEWTLAIVYNNNLLLEWLWIINSDATVGLFVLVGGLTVALFACCVIRARWHSGMTGSEILPVHRLIPAVLLSDSWPHRHAFIPANWAKHWDDPLDGSSLKLTKQDMFTCMTLWWQVS